MLSPSRPRAGPLEFDEEGTSLAGAIQAAYNIVKGESTAGRKRAIVVFTDHEIQNQNPLIRWGQQMLIEHVSSGPGADTLIPACLNRMAAVIQPNMNADPATTPTLQRPIAPDGQALDAHDPVIFAFPVKDAEHGDASFIKNIILLSQMAIETNGEAHSLSGFNESRDIVFTNEFLAGAGW